MREITFIVFGPTGSGKSTLGNALLNKIDVFVTSGLPESCTKETQIGANIVNGEMLKFIDTQGTNDSFGRDDENMKSTVNKLNDIHPSINAFFIVINVTNQRFDFETKKMIETFNLFLNNSDCWKQAAIVFTKCSSDGSEKLEYDRNGSIYQKTVKDYIKSLPRCQNINFELPCFFVRLNNQNFDDITKLELDRMIQFARNFEPIINNFALTALTREDSYDPRKVQYIINNTRKPGQRIISTYAYERNRTLDLNDAGNVIIPVQGTIKEIYEYHLNGDKKDYWVKENPINVNYDFANGFICPVLENQCLRAHRYHRKRNTMRIWWRRKTELWEYELTLHLGGDFIFQQTGNQTLVIRTNMGFCPPFWGAHDEYEEVKVGPIPVTMR